MIYKEQQKKFFEYPFSYHNPVLLLNKINEIIKERPILNEQFEQINLIYHNRLNTLIPKEFFKPETAGDWLSHQVKLPDNEPVFNNYIDSIQAYNIFVPFTNFEKSFSHKTNNLIIKHSGTLFFESIKQIGNQTQNLPVFEIFLNVFPNDFQIAVFKNEKLQAYNHFEYENIEEFIYFLFFAVETLEAKWHQSRFYIFGTANQTELKENLSLFTEKIHFIPEKNPSQIFNYF